MDYFKIGQRIRKYRKAQGISQEQLAEQIGISVTHMSHIETGNTKLSLPVFADIASVLDVRADDLLGKDMPPSRTSSLEMEQLLESCSPFQRRVILDVAKATKVSLEKHGESSWEKSGTK